MLAQWYEQTGNLAKAEAALAQSGRALDRLRAATGRKAKKAWRKHGPKTEFLLTHARARLHDASGNYGEAEALYRSALQKYRRGRESGGKDFRVSPRVAESIRADLGRNLAGQHRLIEGEVQIRTALLSALERDGRYSLVVARLVSELAQVMRAQGRPGDAEALARAALRNLPPTTAKRREFLGFGDPVFDPQTQTQTGAQTETGSAGVEGNVTTRGLPVRLRAAPAADGASSARLSDLPRLPDTAAEIKSMALALRADLARDVLLGAQASESRLKSMDLSVYRVIAFSTHGLIPGDLDGLRQPALALSAPTAGDEDSDGLLTASEILGLRLDADWVVLSACNTAAGGGAGAEAISGLGSAFFYAGARALLVSSWPVETTSARRLTTDTLQRYAADPGAGRAVALRAAMLDLIDGPGYPDPQGRILFSYAHPIFWAPFILVGDGGGANPDS